ncbi:MAG: NUDIX hydrolase [Alphaproteobacteria bacterium]|nr:NUDIX hydrolase [Alphaproteobacteria bacterium]
MSVVGGPADDAVQYAALPWRKRLGKLEILLITTRTTKRWIVPKGWPIPGLSSSDCAAHEAAEEAGVMGHVASSSLGSFRYEKQRRSGGNITCRVEVFAMEVARQRRSWPEKAERETRWCSVDEALGRVSEPGLRRVIAKFGKTITADIDSLERPAVR